MASKSQQQQKYEIHSQAEENPKMKELFDVLLQAGYFRIRIPSFSTFDKILGSLTWCITCSNFDIDIQYDDEMNLGQKIALSEKICNSLRIMECPYDLQPFQIRGLDFDKLYPVINWLIKFVYETREERWDFNTSMSNFLGKKTYPSFIERQKKEENTISETIKLIQTTDKRQTKNVNVKNLQMNDPIRIYSTLIEYGDITAFKTYNKLCGVVSGKIDLENELQKQKKNKTTKTHDPSETGKKKKKEELDLTPILFNDGAGSRAQKVEIDAGKIRNALMSGGQQSQQASLMTVNKGNVGVLDNKNIANKLEATFKKGSLAKMNAEQFNLPQMQMEINNNPPASYDGKSTSSASTSASNQQISAADALLTDPDVQVETQIDEGEQKNFVDQKRRRQSVDGSNLLQFIQNQKQEIIEVISKAAEADESPELEFANIKKNEEEFHQKQLAALQSKNAELEKKVEQESEELFEIQSKEKDAEQYFQQHTQLDEELKQTKQEVQKKLAQSKMKSEEKIAEAVQSVNKLNEMKEKKIKLKKEIKTQMKEFEKESERVKKEAAIVEENELGDEFTADYNKKKKKYDKKFEEFSQLNQEIAVLQRKVENFPSPSEIAQYQLRLLELYESISSESEKEKDNYIRYNNYCDIKTQLLSFVDIMKTFKDNYQVHKKSKSGRTKFIGDLTEAYKGLEENWQSTVEIFNKQKGIKDKKMEELNQLKNVERDYFKLLKDLRLELEVNDTLYQRQ